MGVNAKACCGLIPRNSGVIAWRRLARLMCWSAGFADDSPEGEDGGGRGTRPSSKRGAVLLECVRESLHDVIGSGWIGSWVVAI